MRKRFKIIATIIVFLFSISTQGIITGYNSVAVYADEGGGTSGSNGGSQDGCSYLEGAAAEAAGCEGSNDVLKDVVVNILISIISLGGVISAVYIVIGGVKFISSQGSPEMVQEGRKTLLYAAIGLVISSLAFIIVNFSIKLIYEDVSGSGATDSSSEEGEEEGEESESEGGDTSRINVDDEGYYARSPGVGAGPSRNSHTSRYPISTYR